MSKANLSTLDPNVEWSPWRPTKEQPWSRKWASHLYRRAGFGATHDELKASIASGPEGTLQKLFGGVKEPVTRPRLSFSTPTVDPSTGLPDLATPLAHLRAAWLERMIVGTQPLREKLTLFWHGHFATGATKVADIGLMSDQGETLYMHALGSFRDMLMEIGRDPAMLIWLDSNQNVRGKPNENYAREVMELFALGVGNYSEKDVREAARAFTGWHVHGRRFRFNRDQHDPGEKTILGSSGRWNGDDIVPILLAQKCCAEFICKKLYHFFVSEMTEPTPAFLAPLANAFRNSGYEISVPVKMMLQSRHFYSEHAYRQKVKSPVEYTVGVVRAIGVGATGKILCSPYSLLGPLEKMGQLLYSPPNVKGWEAGQAWLNTASVLARHNFANAIAHRPGELNEPVRQLRLQAFFPVADCLAYARRCDVEEPDKFVDLYANLLLGGDYRIDVRKRLIDHIGDSPVDTTEREERLRDVVATLLTLGESQLC